MAPDRDGLPTLHAWPPPAGGSSALALVTRLHADATPLTRASIAAHFADDVVFTPPPALPDRFRPYFGPAGVAGWLAELEQRGPLLRVLARRYAAAGDHVVVLGRTEVAERALDTAWLWSVRGGRVAAVRAFRYASEALVRLAALAPDG